MSITLSALQKQRTDTAANWTSENPTLLSGELGFESDTGKAKLGDGSTAWTSLGYLGLINSSGDYPLSQLLLPLGSASAPSLAFTGDVNTGLYSPGADQVAISTNGTGRLFVDASGNITIPAGKINAGTAGTSNAVINTADGLFINIDSDGTSSNEVFIIGKDRTGTSGGSELLRVTEEGRLGLGTSSPSYLLHVSGNGAEIGLTDTAVTNATWRLLASTGGSTKLFRIYDSSNAADRLVIDSSGNVGIGTASPGSPLHVYNATTDTVANFESGDAYVAVNFTASDNSMQIATSSTDGLLKNNGAGNLRFFNNGSERARIDSSGRLGIGTSDPSSKLQIDNGLFSADTTSTDKTLLLSSGLGPAGTGVLGASLAFNRIASSAGNQPRAAIAIKEYTGNYEQCGLTFFTHPSSTGTDAMVEQMCITHYGYVGIGTPSPGRQLHIAGTNNILRLESTSTVASRIEFENTGSSSSDSVSIGSVNNDMQLVTSGSERMRIDSSGNLLLGGTASPTSATKSLAIFNGTAPTASVTDGIVLYAEDVSSSSELKVRDEAGNVTTLSPHNFDLIPEGPSEDMAWSYYSEKDGKRINVDMLKAVRLLEQLTGEKLVFTA